MAYKPNDELLEFIRTVIQLKQSLNNDLAVELLRAYDWQAELGLELSQAATAFRKERDAEIERLRGLLAALVDNTPYRVKNNWTCAYCDETNRHAPDCAWERARRAVEE